MEVCIINTGGTISCVGNPLAPMSAVDFKKASTKLLSPILTESFPQTKITYETSLKFPESSNGTLDSTNLQPSDWCLMAQYILDNYVNYDGFVILHGTDSMAFTGSALPFLLNVVDKAGFAKAALSKPVIITGSQVPMYYQKPDGSADDLTLNFNTDAYQNFCGAVACARLGIPEVGVYFETKLYRGDRVLKVNASEFQAFDSPNNPPLAIYGIELEQFPQNMLPGPVSKSVSLEDSGAMTLAKNQLKGITSTIDTFPVMQFNAFPAYYEVGKGTSVIASLLSACIGTNIKGLVLESYGEGNFPSGDPDTPANGEIYEVLADANNNGVVIVDSTQVIAGTVNSSAYASGAWLPKVGALGSYDMTAITSLTKTMILLAAGGNGGWSVADIKTLVQLNLCGEIMNVSRLDSRTNSVLYPGQSIAALDGSAALSNDPLTGPQLTTSTGTFLWAPFGSVPAGKPGRLIMQNDGNLVLYDDNNTALWATDTGVPDGASSVLMISGSVSDKSLVLSVYDYSGSNTTATLYQSS
jgi:L-asparaginase